MSWFGSAVSIDDKVEEATSENLPSGSQDLALNLEICDLIRSKTVTPKDAMRSLKRRLLHKNPNVQIATLHLIDITIKNGGTHFVNEIASREFMDTFVLVLKPLQGSVNSDVKILMLDLLQNWSRAFEGQIALNYVNKVYNDLKNQGYQFPVPTTNINSSFIDTSAPPEWVDSDTCMKSGTAFSFVNRKHHCRNCGGVYIQKYCNNFIALPHFGINEPVRVCDDCYEKITGKKKDGEDSARDVKVVKTENAVKSAPNSENNQEDDDLQRAIKLSLQESENNVNMTAPASVIQGTVEDEDEEMKAAIAASLRDMESKQPSQSQQQSQSLQPQATSNISSFANNLYQLPELQSNNSGHSSNDRSINRYDSPISPQYSGNLTVESSDFTPIEEEAINRYIQIVETMDNAPPGSILQNTALQELNEQVGKLRPKLASGLTTTIDKCEKLEDMHGKLTAVVRLYDKLLEERLAASYRGSNYTTNRAWGGYQRGTDGYQSQNTGRFQGGAGFQGERGQFQDANGGFTGGNGGQFHGEHMASQGLPPQHMVPQSTGQRPIGSQPTGLSPHQRTDQPVYQTSNPISDPTSQSYFTPSDPSAFSSPAPSAPGLSTPSAPYINNYTKPSIESTQQESTHSEPKEEPVLIEL